MVAHDKEECGRGIGGSGVGILTLDERGDGSGGSAYSGGVGVDDVGEVTLAAFPLHEAVQLPTEGAVCDNEVADGGCGAYRLGIKTVHDPVADGEGWRMMAVEEGDGSVLVLSHIADSHHRMTADDELSAHGIVAHG